MAVSESVIVEVLDVVIRDGIDNLRAEGFVDYVMGAQHGADDDLETVEFRDFVFGESGKMNEYLRRIERCNKGSVGESCVFSGREGEGSLAMEPIAAVRRERCDVGVVSGRHGEWRRWAG